MKRTLAIILALMLAMSLVACGGSSGGEVKEPSNVTTGNNTEDTQQVEQTEKNEEPEKTEVTISETVLVDEAGVKITAKRLATDGIFGPEIKLLIENNSGKDLTFQCRNASVNGYMVETMMSVDVVNGKKANDGLTFMESALEACGIDAIADMEFAFHIFDMAEWETYLDTNAIQIKTSIADTFEYTYDDSGDLAYEGNGVKIVVKGLAEDASIFGPSIVVYIENTGNKDVTVQTRDVSINGFMVDALFSCDVVAGKRAVDTITFMDSDLEENDIAAIENVELSFHVFDMAEWETIVDTEVVNITF
ncbi:MAG: hypothetical protein PUB51_06475 [Oscillospiraceae bacterium]|nr:hypothetical protein [Oscillospiraceae bacterium]